MVDTANRAVSLANLTFDQLKQVMFDRLHGGQSFGPMTDSRVGPEPFEWLIEQFQQGDSGLRDRVTAAVREFLGELTDLEKWPAPARSNLLDLIQDCGDALVDDIRRLIRTRTLLNLENAGAPAHAGLLKCLISFGHRETPEFWIEQFELLGPEYGALIFSGLIDHGLDTAVQYLPRLSADEHACQQIRLLIPVLEDQFGAKKVAQAFQAQLNSLSKAARAALSGDLNFAVESNVAVNRCEVKDVVPKFGTLEQLTGTSGTWGELTKTSPERLREMIFTRKAA